ncbi:MAG: ArsR/SmtB family transcription factor [Haloarculaceae archaeon]
MATATDRLRRLLAERLADCCAADVDRRLAELDVLADAAFADDGARPVFAVLGNDTRYRLARALAVADEELCVCELEALVDVSESAVSHALADLVDAGLATRRKDGNWRYYAATPLAASLFATADAAVEPTGGGEGEA